MNSDLQNDNGIQSSRFGDGRDFVLLAQLLLLLLLLLLGSLLRLQSLLLLLR